MASTTAEGAADDKLVDGFSDDDRAGMSEGSCRHEFQSEASRLMDITISSLYTDKQVFLREIISNAAVALEKAHWHDVQDDSFLGNTNDLEIKVKHDLDARTISVIDCLIVDPPPAPTVPVEVVKGVGVTSEVEAVWLGLAGHLDKFQIQDVLKLTVRELDIRRTAEELSTLDSQIRLKFPFSVLGSLVLPETLSIDSFGAYTNVFMTTDTLRTSQLFKDMTTLPTRSRQYCLHSGPCLQSFRVERSCISKMRRPSSVGRTSNPGTGIRTGPSSRSSSMPTRTSCPIPILDILRTTAMCGRRRPLLPLVEDARALPACWFQQLQLQRCRIPQAFQPSAQHLLLLRFRHQCPRQRRATPCPRMASWRQHRHQSWQHHQLWSASSPRPRFRLHL